MEKKLPLKIVFFALCFVAVFFYLAADSREVRAAEDESLWQKAVNVASDLKSKIFQGFEQNGNWIDKVNEAKKKQLEDIKNYQGNDNAMSDAQTRLEMDKKYGKWGKSYANTYSEQNNDDLGKKIDAMKEENKKANGSTKYPYKIEPNQFRKICDENKYVLYSRIGGASGTDLANPIKPPPGEPTKPAGEQSFWRVPTCDELASCHCCGQTCLDPVIMMVGEPPVPIILCLPNVSFGGLGACSPLCKAPIGRTACDSYSGAAFGSKGDRDCMLRANGCESSGGCEIIIRDPNHTQFEYSNPPNSLKFWKSNPGDTVVPPGSLIKKLSNAASLPQGWIGQLAPEKGECCKCIQR